MPVWTREPVDLTVSTSPSTITNQNGQLTVSVSGMAYSEYATNDVTVCVMKDNEVYLREYYNGTAHSHNFVFDVVPETAGELKVTVTGHNYIPYETTVPVSITGKNLFVSQKAVQDAIGNNDGKLDAGETVNLSISLKNNGTVNLANVNATLSCEFTDAAMNQNLSSYLTLTTANASYGTITKNTTVTRNNYQLTLSNTVPDRSALRCTLTVADGAGATWTKTFTLPIGAAEMDYVAMRHQVKPNGRIGLDIELTNTGFGTAKGITATLTSQDVQVTTATADYGAFSHLQSKPQSFEFIPNGNYNGSNFNLNITDAYNKSWSFGFDLNTVTDTVTNLAFESTEHSIKLKWDPLSGSTGYNVYRSMTWNGDYVKQNSHPLHSSAYSDLGLDVMQTYCYGVTFLDASGNESPMARIKAWTTLPMAAGWPVSIPDGLGRPWSTAPNVADVDGDGKQEVFLTAGTGDGTEENKGSVLGFNYLGEELYDIDHNPTTVSGFANLGISMTCAPAPGDIDNDGVMEIVVATRDNLNNNHKLLVNKYRDSDQDGIPDLVWEHTLDYKNFNGVVLTDLDDNGTLEIIAPNQGRDSNYGHTYLEVFNASGTYYYPKNTIKVADMRNHDGKAVTMPVVADLDNDGHKEIVFGLEGGVFSWSCHDEQLSTLVPYSQTSNERTDCPVVAADLDGDGEKEILYMAVKDRRGYVRAVNPDGTSVSGWNGNTHYVSLTSTDMDYAWTPYFTVADIDSDGDIEVFAADRDTLKMWNSDGTAHGVGFIPISNLDSRYFQPVIADIDGYGDCEVIVPSQEGYIFAYKTNGNAVTGWPLRVDELATIPVVTDLDGDGLNEIVAASKTGVFVWHTEGESKHNHCDRFRYNKYNNAVYETPCSYSDIPLEISGIQVWVDDRQINKDVIVNSGARLTVKSELRLSGFSKIIVKPGGRLVLDGCTLTSSCPDGMWPGIEVWGDSNAHQQEVNGSYLQGYVELKNGATIENARCALRLRNPLVGGTSGGIVHATGAIFRNNALSVEASCFTNHGTLSQRELDYNGWFRDCTFTVDEDYLAQTAFHSHASLSEVNGIGFEGCALSVDRNVDSVDFLCAGIAAYNTTFTVKSYCSGNTLPCPSQDVTRSSFTGFHRGVGSVNDGQCTRSFIVRDSDFLGNDIGVFSLNTSTATAVGNTFTVGGLMDCSYGVYLEGVSVCRVEENAFTAATGTMSVTYGTVVKDSPAANDVYLNQFTGLDYGNLAIGRNTVVTQNGGQPSITTGLTYSCNDNASNAADFRIDDNGDLSGVQPVQGSPAIGAGNTFSGSSWHIHNDGDYYLTYHYYGADPSQVPAGAKLFHVNTSASLAGNSCLSHYGQNPIKQDRSGMDSLRDIWASARQSYESLSRLYQSQAAEMQNADALVLALTVAEMTEYAHKATEAAGDILRSLANSPGSDNRVLRDWLEALECPEADRIAVASLLEEGDTDGACEAVLAMQGKYGPKQLDPEEHEGYIALVGLYAALRRTGRTAFELTDMEKLLVDRTATEGKGQSRIMARALLEGIGGSRNLMICPADIIEEFRGDSGTNGNRTWETDTATGFAVSVIPTPASTWITVEYALPDCCNHAVFELTDMTGIKVLTTTLNGKEGRKTLDLQGLSGGVYLYSVSCEDHTIFGKVVVSK